MQKGFKICETIAFIMLHLNEKSLAPFIKDGADFVQQATSDNLKRQSPSEIVILTNKNPVKWMK